MLTAVGGSQTAPDVDYETYAEGEALLGWLNATVNVSSSHELDGNLFLQSLAARLRSGMETGEIAHLKMTMTPDEGNDIAVLNLVRNDASAELSHWLQAPIQSGQLIINLRAEDDPEQLWARTRAALDATTAEVNATPEIEQHEFFRPAKPNPTHRMAIA